MSRYVFCLNLWVNSLTSLFCFAAKIPFKVIISSKSRCWLKLLTLLAVFNWIAECLSHVDTHKVRSISPALINLKSNVQGVAPTSLPQRNIKKSNTTWIWSFQCRFLAEGVNSKRNLFRCLEIAHSYFSANRLTTWKSEIIKLKVFTNENKNRGMQKNWCEIQCTLL